MRKIFSPPIKILPWLLALSLLAACGGDEPVDPTPPTPVTPVDPTPPTPEKDTTAPTITVAKASVNVIAGPSVTVSGNELKIGSDLVASWKDDKSTACTVALSFITNGTSKTINSGDKLSEEGKLQVNVTDEAGNSSTSEITLTRTDSEAPKIEVLVQEKNVVAGVKVKIEGNQLFFDDQVGATWTDDFTEICSTLLSLDGQAINSGDILLEAGKLVISVSDDFKNETKAEITLTAVAVYGLEILQSKTLQVDQEVNLLQGVTFAEGLTLQKVEVEQDGTRSEIAHPESYSPQIPGTIGIVLSLARTDGSTIEVKVDNLTVKGIQYQAMKITDLKPVEILPIIGQIVSGDKYAYDHIDHLRIAEATVIRDMMWKYGAGNYTMEEYQGFMDRLNIGMVAEIPLGYDNYEMICTGINDTEATKHAYNQWSILCSLTRYANFKVVPNFITSEGFYWNWENSLLNYVKDNSNSINIFWCSAFATAYDNEMNGLENWILTDDFLDLRDEKNFLIYATGTNIAYNNDGVFVNKVYNSEYACGEHGCYSLASLANSDKNTSPESHVFVTVANQANGNIDQTNETITSTRFPVGFANNALFSWRAFPYIVLGTWKVYAEGGSGTNGKYSTSYTGPLNACMTALCFQMFAEAADVDVLLEMIRSTCLTDHIHLDLNGDGDTNDIIDGHPETVPLQLINPGGFFKKYCMPSSIPTAIGTDETINFEKGYYKGVVFNIPGAEVMIGDEWIPFDSKNKDLILSQNPMNLTWRINGNLLKKMGYTAGQTVQGQIITIDDQWNGLRLEVPMTITIN